MKRPYIQPECLAIKLASPTLLVPASAPLAGTEGTDDINLDTLLGL